MRRKIKKKANQSQRKQQCSIDTEKSASPSSSSQKAIKNISLYKIENIEKLKKLKRLSLSKSILERMVEKRSLDLIKQRNTIQKRHIKSSFIDYTFNPLAVAENKYFPQHSRSKQRKVSLIDALSQLKGEKQKSRWAIQKLRERTEGRIDFILNYKYHFQKDIDFSQKVNTNTSNRYIAKQGQKQRQILHKSFLDLDKIMVINDSRMRITKKQELNIFQILFKKRRQIFIEIDSLLLKHNFYFQSILYGLSKQTRFNPYKDISIYNRYFTTSQLSKIPQTYQLTPLNMFVVLSCLNSNDLLLIASGKLSPSILAQYVNLHVHQNIDNQQEKYLLKQNQLRNQKNNPLFKNRVNIQINTQLNFSAGEKQWRVPTNDKFQYLQQLQSLIASEKKGSELQIKDKRLNLQMKGKKQCFLFELLNRNSPNKYKNVDNKIKQSKANKDSFQNSRNKAISQIFRRYKEQLRSEKQQNSKKSLSIILRGKNRNECNSPMIKSRKLSADIERHRKSSTKANKSTAFYD